MRSFPSPGAFAAHLRRVAQAIPAAEHDGLDRAGKLIEAEAKALIGTEMEEWPELAPESIAEKERLGYTGRISATDPLLRTGELRATITHEVDGRRVVIGTEDRVGAYLEFGTERMPPRPFLAPALFRKGEEAANAITGAVARAVAGLPPELD